MKRHIVIAIPAYAGTIHLGTMRSVVHDLMQLMRRGDNVSVEDECGNTDITDARAKIVSKFLAGPGTDLVFVDHDVCWEASALVKLVDYPVEFVSGIYPQRSDPIKYNLRYIEDRPEIMGDAKTGLIEVGGVSAGFMRCSRKMLEKMTKAYPGLAYTRDNMQFWGLFDPYRLDDGKRKLSEDYSFCQRWRDIGGQVWVDPNIKMGHIGYKTFAGNLGHWLKERTSDDVQPN